MANPVVKNLAEQLKLPVPVVEIVWRKAKRFATNEGQKGNYLLVLEVTKRMLGVTETMKRVRLGQKIKWKTEKGEILYGTVEATLPDSCMVKVLNPESSPTVEALLKPQRHGIVTVPLLDVILL